MLVTRRFTVAGKNVFDMFEWERRRSEIKDETTGKIVFEMDGVEVPKGWSQTATDILANKYFRKTGVPQRAVDREWAAPLALFPASVLEANGYLCEPMKDEPLTPMLGPERSMKQVAHRLAGFWRHMGEEGGYFSSDPEEAQAFYDEAVYMLCAQMAAPNSPQWFNAGLYWAYGISGNGQDYYRADPKTGVASHVTNAYKFPNLCACYLQPVNDSLIEEGGIFDLLKKEAKLFKYGSGSGTNFSNLRAQNEPLSGGGRSSGLMSWLKIYDAAAGAIKSGGTTRRAAKLVSLDMDHPDIERFITLKSREELKVHALVEGAKLWSDEDKSFAESIGLKLDYDFNGEAYGSVDGQNANNSVRVPDIFMRKVFDDEIEESWRLTERTTGAPVKNIPASGLWDKLVDSAWRCGDPGVQFEDTINAWNTVPNSGKNRTSNPCLVGETLVDTAEGRIRIDDLAKMHASGKPLPHVWAFSRKQGLPVLRRITQAWKTKKTSQLIEVLTDKGLRIRCTPDHRFLLRNGEYVEAQNLCPGMRLRKIGRWVNTERSSRRCLNFKTTERHSNGTAAQSLYMWEQIHGAVPDGFHVHHINEDPTDDRLSNFMLRPALEHTTEHSLGKNNPRYIDADESLLVEVWEAIENEKPLPCANRASHGKVTPAKWNRYVRQNGLQGKVPLGSYDGIRGLSWDGFAAWIETKRDVVNDKVFSITLVETDMPVPVYDLSVEGTHNFAVSNESDTGRHTIVVHNCGEHLCLDNTACNLASLNVVKFYDEKTQGFNAGAFADASRLWQLVLEITFFAASFPSKEMAEGSWKFRPTGLGYANLGALIMQMGLAYDSDKGRSVAAEITSVLTASAYLQSSRIAERVGAFDAYNLNKDAMCDVIAKHAKHAHELRGCMESDLLWNEIIRYPLSLGFRNCYVTCIAPTGTIGLVMDCDTTGCEPEFSLVKYKKLVGGGTIKSVNQSIEPALRAMGYPEPEIKECLRRLNEVGHLDGGWASETPGVRYKHMAIKRPMEGGGVLDCAMPGSDQGYAIPPMGHVKMLAAIQPFVSMGISKTINLPKEATRDDVSEVYEQSWRLGVKCVALYRDGCKQSQPLNVKKDEDPVEEMEKESTRRAQRTKKMFQDAGRWKETSAGLVPNDVAEKIVNQIIPPIPTNPPAIPHPAYTPQRAKLPDTSRSIRHKFSIGNSEGYLHVGLDESGKPLELFIRMSKQGSTLGGLVDAWAISISTALQWGVPLDAVVQKFAHQKFEPSGITANKEIPFASSIVDYIAQWLGLEFLPGVRESRQETKRILAGSNGHKVDALKLHETIARHTEGSMIAVDHTPPPAHTQLIPQFSIVADADGVTKKYESHVGTSDDTLPCPKCGSLMRRMGRCHTCVQCGENAGCS